MPTLENVFVSYATADYAKVRHVADELAKLQIRLWFGKPGYQQTIVGGEHFAPAIARGIKQAQAVALMCSDAALRSRNVNQEIVLAWKYGKPYLPLLLESVSYPEQSEYFLEGWQWIEVLDRPSTEWLPLVEQALARIDALSSAKTIAPSAYVDVASVGFGVRSPEADFPRPRGHLAALRSIASFTDRLWPVAADSIRKGSAEQSSFRGLGAPQTGARRAFRLGSQLCLALEAGRDGHLLLLDEGPEGITYCLCPSLFAPNTHVTRELAYLPQRAGGFDAFEISGVPGREHLLAIVTELPLRLEWLPPRRESPARILSDEDVAEVLRQLNLLEPGTWTAFATYFDVLPREV